MNAFVVHTPTTGQQRLVHARSAKARSPTCHTSLLSEQRLFVRLPLTSITRRAPQLAQHAADSTFRPQATTYLRDRSPPTLRAYQIPQDASLRISITCGTPTPPMHWQPAFRSSGFPNFSGTRDHRSRSTHTPSFWTWTSPLRKRR